MQVTETLVEGLKREFKVVVPATELDDRLNTRLSSLKDEVRIKGFRPGKVPVNHLRRLYGKSAMAEIVQGLISEVARKTMADRGERTAAQPDYELPEDQTEAEQVLDGKADLTFTMRYEVLPKVEQKDYKAITVERPTVAVTDEELDAEVKRVAATTATYTPKDGKAGNGDRVTISYVGKLNGEPFEGGSDDNAVLLLGSNQFIPGFAEQLDGVVAGEEKTISVTFPEDYGAKKLAGQAATFDIKVKEVASPEPVTIDDALAERLGLESVEKLREAVSLQMQNQYTAATRQKVKRQLLDQLDSMYTFELPSRMVQQEFDNIWQQVTTEMTQSGRTFEDEKTTEETARADYRKIAERRVRLGLVLSEIGEKNKIDVTDEEVQRALAAQLRQFPGREQVLLDYYRKNPDAVAGLRAPIFEEKVVDLLLELVNVQDKTVTREELLRDDEEGA